MDMLSRGMTIDRDEGDDGNEAPASISSMVEHLTGFVRRQYKILIACPAAAIVICLLYLLVTPSQFTATATLLIDSSPLRGLQNQFQPHGDVPLDTLEVGSQVEILSSDMIALAVIRKLKLVDDPEFVDAKAGLGLADANLIPELEQKALGRFASHRAIARLERTYAVDISFTSRNPRTAANVANAIADAYMADKIEAKDQTRLRAGSWLQDRINEIREQVASADRAVLEFKERNNIVDVAGGPNGTAGLGTSNRLIGEQQLIDLNSQLATARNATGEAKARLDRIEQVRKMNVGQATVADTLKSEVINRLRNQYLDLSAREANLSFQYGSDHGAAVNLRNQMEELSKNIGTELGRIAASYQSDYEIAKSRQGGLERALAKLVSEGQVTNRDRLGLAELESSAKIYHTIYDNFLQHYTEAIQQQSFPITDARVISFAAPPAQKSKPKGSLALAVAATMGIIAGLGVAAWREATDSVFRTNRQIERSLRVRCLSVIPLLNAKSLGVSAIRPPLARHPHVDDDQTRAPDERSPVALPDRAACFSLSSPILRYAVDDPLSGFAEAIRAIKVSAQLQTAIGQNNKKVIGVTSTLPNEGKSTVACNLAALMADAGKRVILVDTDLRNPNLAGSLEPKPAYGLLELLQGKIELPQAIGNEPDTHLTLLPLVLKEPIAHADEILSSQAFKTLIGQLRHLFDYVILDLPPVAPVVDVRAVLPVVESLVLVVEWGVTRIAALQRSLTAPEISGRLLGVVLNKANLKVLQRFEPAGIHHDGYYANRGYSRPSRMS